MTLNNPSTPPTSNYQTFANCTNNQIPLVANKALTFSKSNLNRSYCIIMNNGQTPITIILGGNANTAIGQGIVIQPNGNYEILASNLYTGQITALAPTDCTLSYVECSWS